MEKTTNIKADQPASVNNEAAAEVIRYVIAGLSSRPRRLPSKYFYDSRGSRLFDAICETEAYYPTRTERQILNSYREEISQAIGRDAVLIEPGCGSCEKTRIILNAHPSLRAFIPIDFSAEYLGETADRLREEFKDLEILPVAADFMQPLELPQISENGIRKTVFYPGSTVGNFLPERARAFLKTMAALTGEKGALILGVDQIKDTDILERAYNDEEGLTAAFNLNMLHNINKLAGTRIFEPDAFHHRAIWNDDLKRIEMHLVSKKPQQVEVSGNIFEFETDDYIVSEYSHKYNDEMVAELAEGLYSVKACWKDENHFFGLYHLEAVSKAAVNGSD